MGAQTARNDLLRAENEMLVAEEALKVESNRKSIFLLISFSLLIILTGLYVFYQRSKLANSRLRAQQQIIETKNQELELASSQKDNLYRELHHRVKNNLTNLSGLLYLQERGLNSEEAKKALGETRSRIQSMSLVHEGLYEQDEDVRIHFNTFLSELMPNLLSAFGGISERVDWSLDCEDFKLEVEIAMPLGMIVNELITNSFKYAFLNERAGKLTVIGRALGKNGWVMSIQDDGPGMPEQFDWEHPDSLGLKLVKVFVDEMGAEFSYGYFDCVNFISSPWLIFASCRKIFFPFSFSFVPPPRRDGHSAPCAKPSLKAIWKPVVPQRPDLIPGFCTSWFSRTY